MARTETKTYITSQEIFAVRLSEAMKTANTNQTKLSKTLENDFGITMQRQTISQYMNGQSKPDTERLTYLCKALNVSADWLLGLTDVPTLDKDIQFICEKTGMSQKTIENLVYGDNADKLCYSAFLRFLEKGDNLYELGKASVRLNAAARYMMLTFGAIEKETAAFAKRYSFDGLITESINNTDAQIISLCKEAGQWHSRYRLAKLELAKLLTKKMDEFWEDLPQDDNTVSAIDTIWEATSVWELPITEDDHAE